MSAAVPLNTQIQLERGSQCAGSSKGSRGAPSPETVGRIWTILGAGLADEETPLAFDASPTVTTVACIVAEIERRLVEALMIEGIALRYGFFYGSGIWFNPDGDVAQRVLLQQSPIVGNGEGVWSWLQIEDTAVAPVAAPEQGNLGVYLIATKEAKVEFSKKYWGKFCWVT